MEVIAKIFNFVVLFGVLGYLCRNLLKNMFGGRREGIGRELETAEEAREKAKTLADDMEKARALNEERKAEILKGAEEQIEIIYGKGYTVYGYGWKQMVKYPLVLYYFER